MVPRQEGEDCVVETEVVRGRMGQLLNCETRLARTDVITAICWSHIVLSSSLSSSHKQKYEQQTMVATSHTSLHHIQRVRFELLFVFLYSHIKSQLGQSHCVSVQSGMLIKHP